MTLTEKISNPLLRGTLVGKGPWGALLAQSEQRIYPYQLGCMVRSDSTGTTVNTHGLGEFRQNNYFMACRETDYGDSALYIPDVNRIGRVASNPLTATDDQLTIDAAMTLDAGDYLINLGNDTAPSPTTSPSYDGSLVTLYTDPVGNTQNPLPYLLTASGGWFRGWCHVDYDVVDLLVMTASGVPQVVKPLHVLGPELIP